MEALKVTFNLDNTGVVMPVFPLHLDSLAAYAVTQRYLPFLEAHSIEALRALSDDLPIEKHRVGNDWVYKASALVPEGTIEHTTHFYTQRIDQDQYAKDVVSGKVTKGKYVAGQPLKPHALKLDVVRGHDRNMLGFYPIANIRKLVAYCIADKEALEEILIGYDFITHIGKRRRQGYGRISSIEIERDEAALIMWQHRVKPWKLVDDDEPIMATCRPPYFDKTLAVEAYIPGTLI